MKKNYETPDVEILEIQLEGVLCTSEVDNLLFEFDDQDFGGIL